MVALAVTSSSNVPSAADSRMPSPRSGEVWTPAIARSGVWAMTVPDAELSWNSIAALAEDDRLQPRRRILLPDCGVQTVSSVPAVIALASIILKVLAL